MDFVLQHTVVYADQASSLGSSVGYTAPLLLGSAFFMMGVLFVYFRRRGSNLAFRALASLSRNFFHRRRVVCHC